MLFDIIAPKTTFFFPTDDKSSKFYWREKPIFCQTVLKLES